MSADIAKLARTAAAWCLACAGVLYLMSDTANAKPPVSEDRYLTIIAKQEAYIKTLEMAVTVCFDGDGHGPALPQQANNQNY